MRAIREPPCMQACRNNCRRRLQPMNLLKWKIHAGADTRHTSKGNSARTHPRTPSYFQCISITTIRPSNIRGIFCYNIYKRQLSLPARSIKRGFLVSTCGSNKRPHHIRGLESLYSTIITTSRYIWRRKSTVEMCLLVIISDKQPFSLARYPDN